MVKQRLFISLLCCLLAGALQAQVVKSYAIYDIPSSARTAALGMDFLSVDDADLSLTLDNPSLIDERCHLRFGLNYVGLFGEAKAGSASMGLHSDVLGDFVFAMRFVSFGTFDGYDEYEVPTGEFNATDFIPSIGWGKQLNDNLSIGATFKPVLSFYDAWTSVALAFDVAGTYRSDSRNFSATLIGRNIGAQLSRYDGHREALPFHLDAGISYKLPEAPIRFYLQAADLQRWNLAYYDTLSLVNRYDSYTGETSRQTSLQRFGDNLFRHLNFAVELCIGQKIFARVGYSYRQTREMRSDVLTNINLSGFSYGVGVRARRFEFCYARNNYHLGQSPNYLSLNFYF